MLIKIIFGSYRVVLERRRIMDRITEYKGIGEIVIRELEEIYYMK